MQDRFKFRVWDKEQNKMFKAPRHFNFCDVNGTIVCIESYMAFDGFMYKRIIKEFNDAILMQSTGLKDKNGKLIYEGDILKYLSGTVNKKFVKYVTKWNDDMGRFYISKINPSEYDNWKDWHLGRHDLDYEIIGNIYENEDLLNGNR